MFDQVGGLPGNRIGKIELSGGRATVEVPGGWETRVAKALDGASLGGRTIRAWAGPGEGHKTTVHEDHFRTLSELLELERETEARRALERSRRLSPAEAERTGDTLVDLVIIDEEAGLGGRYILSLAKRRRTPLPWTRLDSGSPVVLSPEGVDAKLPLRASSASDETARFRSP